MEPLITTVRERYMRTAGYRGMTTLAYRKHVLARAADTEESRKRGFLGLLRPQLQSISKSLHQEIGKLFERRDKLLMQSVSHTMPKIVGQNTAQMRSDRLKAEKAMTDRAVRLEKRMERLTADGGAKLKDMQRELLRLRMAERERMREEGRRAYEQPIIERDAQRSVSREIQQVREVLLQDIGMDIKNTERRITRRLRDDDEYEKRRRG